MQVYNIDKIKKNIELDLQNRKLNNKKGYLNQYNLYKKNNLDYFNEIIAKRLEDKDLKKINNKFKTVENRLFKYNIFNNCNFTDIKFYKCKFMGNKFNNCKFENVSFEECDFYTVEDDISIFNNKTSFRNSYFKNCNLEKSVFQDINLDNIHFINNNMKNIIFNNVCIDNICICDCDFRSLKIINSDIIGLKFNDSFLTKFDENTFIDEVKLNKKCKKTYEEAFKVYREFAIKFEANRLIDYSGEYYYKSKVIENKYLSGNKKIKLYIHWLLCGYGERPTYALITSIEIVLIFAIIYMITGLNIGGYIIDYNVILNFGLTMPNLIPNFMKSLYFSIVTFTTVGYGDITPVGISVFLSGIEMLLGVTMVGIWTATLARKITR